jgi:hypothetical protein
MAVHARDRCQKTISSLVALLTLTIALSATQRSVAAVTSTTQHGPSVDSLDSLITSTDLIQGKNTLDVDVFERFFDSYGNESIGGWHPVNDDPADQFAAFTDGIGMRPSNLSGLLADFPFEGSPAKIVEYPFDSPVDIGQINIFTGNQDADGRIFSTTYIEYSTDGGATFQGLGYFQSDPSGTINSTGVPDPQRSTLLSIFDDASPTLLSGVTNIIFNLYAVDNTGGQMRDPFDGVNDFTGLDDGLSAAFVSPKVLELDVLPPEVGLAGDYNGDGTVDAADYVVWRKDPASFGGDPAGYDTWRANFGTMAMPAAGQSTGAVPEPAAISAIISALGTALAIRFRAVQ